jgi:hypothetical protein
MDRQIAAAFHEVILLGLTLFFLYTSNPITTEDILKFEWNEQDLTPEERMEIQEFLDRVNDLGLENAFFDEEALVFIDGTHVPIPEKVKVIRD